MNKLAIITGFLGETRNRYMVYQGNRSLQEKFEMLSQIKGADGVELCYPADFENVAEPGSTSVPAGRGSGGEGLSSRRRQGNDGSWWTTSSAPWMSPRN